MAELAALHLPSVLVPYPFAADDHQRANAEDLVKVGAAVMLEDAACDGARLARELVGMLRDRSRLDAMRAAAARMARPEAAVRIAEACLMLATS